MTTLEWFRTHKSSHPWKMEDMYRMLHISKQAHYKQVRRYQDMQRIEQDIVEKVIATRQQHPRMGARKLYHLLQPEGIGRDKFEAILFTNGFKLHRKKNYTRTTYSHPWYRYDNLISQRKVKAPYQVWVSDITYIPVTHKSFYYLVLIQDIYTRKVVGWSLSDNLRADNVISALQEAISTSSGSDLKGLIFHSDRGSQYLYTKLLKLQERYGIIASMGNKAWENAHAESINGVLKGEYIQYTVTQDLQQTQRRIKKIIRLYNHKRPHGSLKMKTPQEFEDFLQGVPPPEEKPIVKINY